MQYTRDNRMSSMRTETDKDEWMNQMKEETAQNLEVPGVNRKGLSANESQMSLMDENDVPFISIEPLTIKDFNKKYQELI